MLYVYFKLKICFPQRVIYSTSRLFSTGAFTGVKELDAIWLLRYTVQIITVIRRLPELNYQIVHKCLEITHRAFHVFYEIAQGTNENILNILFTTNAGFIYPKLGAFLKSLLFVFTHPKEKMKRDVKHGQVLPLK